MLNSDYICLTCEKAFDVPHFRYPRILECPFCGSGDYIPLLVCDLCQKPILNDFIELKTGEKVCENCFSKQRINDLPI